MKHNHFTFALLFILLINNKLISQDYTSKSDIDITTSEVWIELKDFNDTCSSTVITSYQIDKKGYAVKVKSKHFNDTFCEEIFLFYISKYENELGKYPKFTKKEAKYKKGIIFQEKTIYHFNIKP